MAAKKPPLKARLEPRLVPLLIDADQQLEIVAGWAREDQAKLALLADEMGIADGPHRWYELALGLARKHHYAFQERVSQVKWTDVTLGYLVVEIKRLRKDQRKCPGHTVTWAAGVLAKRPEWADFLSGGKDSAEALRRQYERFEKQRWAKVAWDAFKFHEKTDTVDEWDRDIRDALRERDR